jgi:amino acid transporter
MTAPSGLARKSIGTGSMFWFAVGASAPMVVLAGGVIATYAATGVVGVPLSFLVLAAALALFTVGYVAMSRYVPHAATFYAYLARGLGRVWGVSGSAVALVAYNCIQISLYGLAGATMSGLLGGRWWLWALGLWAVVALLGVLHVALNAVVLASVLFCEIVVILMFDAAAFTHPAGGSFSLVPMTPDALFVNGVGGAFALGIAAFIGYESAPVYGEEARSHRAVARATYGALLFIGLLYAASAWALAVNVGPAGVVDAARDPSSGIPFSIIEAYYGKALLWLATLLLITSIFAALLSFHNSVARYIFGLSRERVLPALFGHVGSGASRAGAPIGGSLVQSGTALAVIVVFAAVGADPLTMLFTWLSTIAAIGVMLLMAATSLAVIRFFRRGGGTHESVWQRSVAPTLGALAIAAVLATTVVNLSSLVGAEPGSALTWVLPGIIGGAAVVGLSWGLLLRARPDVYRGIGLGEPEPLAVLEHDLSDLQV